jgi:hypothetical protein
MQSNNFRLLCRSICQHIRSNLETLLPILSPIDRYLLDRNYSVRSIHLFIQPFNREDEDFFPLITLVNLLPLPDLIAAELS